MGTASIRYARTADGRQIAYSVEGSGPPLLSLPDFIESFSVHHYDQRREAFQAGLSAGHTFIRMDWRGTGLSGRRAPEITLDTMVSDIEAVMMAAGASPCVVWAPTLSGPAAIRLAARRRMPLSALVLCGTFATGAHALPRDLAVVWEPLARTNWPVAARVIADGGDRDAFPGLSTIWARMYADSASAHVAIAYLRAFIAADVSEELADLDLPVLILHNRGDPAIPFHVARQMAVATRSATLVALPGNYHSAYGTDDDAMRTIGAVREFLGQPAARDSGQEARDGSAPARALTAREIEVLKLIASGRSTREISEDLVLSERTVARHIANIYAKIGAHGRAEATAYAFRNRIA